MSEASLRSLPSVDRLLHAGLLADAQKTVSREVLVSLARQALAEARERSRSGDRVPALDEIAADIVQRIDNVLRPSRSVLNATGVILHTNLGRAPLSSDARAAVAAAGGYTDLELDLANGDRGSRQARVADILRLLTGAEAAHVTVNNAAAVLLLLRSLAGDKDVIVSRGQAVEIGGGFRVPVILRQSGARLVEVGTTNRTRLSDYEDALSPKTGAILHIHSSNFRIVGFTESVDIAELAALARRHEIPFIVDNGSGALLDTAGFGLVHEPMPRDALEAGASLVAFSGDKLLGGPQAGIILGDAEHVRRAAKHPLSRALRPDKMTLTALTATLGSYLRGAAVLEIPVWQMIAQTSGELKSRATAWRDRASAAGLSIDLRSGESTIGGGSLPGETLPTTLIELPPTVDAAALRTGRQPIVARTHRGLVLLDLRTIPAEDDDRLLEAVLEAVPGARSRVIDSATR